MIKDKNNMSYKDFLMLQETERSRIAEDLHDTTVQELVALSQKLDLANLYFDKDVTQARLELISAKKQIKDIIEDIRNTIYDLRPMSFDDFGWDASIERLYRDVDQKSDMNVTFDIDSINSVDNVIQITVYRILREAVTNVYKHAKASRLYVTLHIQNKEIYLEIRDDGIGIQSDIKENHFGMCISFILSVIIYQISFDCAGSVPQRLSFHDRSVYFDFMLDVYTFFGW